MSADLPTLVSPDVLARRAEHAAHFAKARPFRHVVIDGFLREDIAERLLAQFPPFEHGNARTENGTLGNKSTIERIRALGSAYEALDDAIQNQRFLGLIGEITGIPGLRYDPYYFGGGTHENRQGQDLDPHVDFNRHPVEGWHRRLNLIVYLNHEWEDAWGGSLELHSDPRAADDQVTLVTPAFNRAIIFETTESSWHGFSRIDLPPQRAQLTRKSVALYFYSDERPAEELADTHSTIYVERPLPARYAAGTTLSDADVEQLRGLLARRDQHIQRLYRDISRLGTELEQARAALYAGRLGRLRHFLRSARAHLRR
ncbi:MAG TPA: 2OG-Fe(II) oxygenase [Rhodanobacteraceae bacterium]|nr:2OG-Fe(II) oxygenase [Rhodanobacteraceae bacterium]